MSGSSTAVRSGAVRSRVDPRAQLDQLLSDLDSRRSGLSTDDAQKRLATVGPNELLARAARRWPRRLARQFIHPLALLLGLAALLAIVSRSFLLAGAIIGVIVINAVFAFAQERQAERAVDALARYLPQRATVRRSDRRLVIDARDLVPGDVIVVDEGDRISADARLVQGALEVDLSTLTGESAPQFRDATETGPDGPLLEAQNLVFSGTTCTEGEAEALVYATGMGTELGRIAALSERVQTEESPLEKQVRRVAWLIAVVAVVAGALFLPVGWLVAGLDLADASKFAVGLIVANVPEGLLPTLTLALAAGVATLARRGALVRRLSAVETLGSTTVICTDKTGTLTQNRMLAQRVWTPTGEIRLDDDRDVAAARSEPVATRLAQALAACSSAELASGTGAESRGDPTEIGLLEAARILGADVDVGRRERGRVARFSFDPTLRLMATVDRCHEGGGTMVHVKGAPEAVIGRSSRLWAPGGPRPMNASVRDDVQDTIERLATQGLRVLAVADRPLTVDATPPRQRDDVERDLTLLGFVGLFDPPRPEVTDAVARCHRAGVRIMIVTGDHGGTAAETARRVGIATEDLAIVTGDELESMDDDDLDRLLCEHREPIFARVSPEAKLRIADVLQAQGQVVAMTGDGVNDAPALRHADIGVAMGRGGTDVAREAAAMVLIDDDFTTIVAAVAAGRQVYANVRKFILYIFAHLGPEAVPILVFALSGGAVPLPMTVLQILAIDLGTEIVPAIALGREPAEPGLMEHPPRPRSEGVVQRSMLFRAWIFLGLIEAALVLAGFFAILLSAGWTLGADVGTGSPLHHAYLQATTMTFAGVVACQVGAAIAARTERVSLRSIGLFTNRLLIWGIVFEIAFAAAIVYLPPIQDLFATAALGPVHIAMLATFPVIVWGADETRRMLRRHRVVTGADTGGSPSKRITRATVLSARGTRASGEAQT